MRQPSSFRTLIGKIGNFVFHFAEMWFAMIAGMAVFMVLRIALTVQGYVALLDPTSLEFQVGMGMFMVGPMAAWMRVRGCSWRECGEMCSVMLLSTGGAVVLRRLDLREALLWLAGYQHTLMLVGMLVVMLYRREHYTREYSFGRWSATSRGRRQEVST